MRSGLYRSVNLNGVIAHLKLSQLSLQLTSCAHYLPNISASHHARSSPHPHPFITPQHTINYMKDELFAKALGCRRYYLIKNKAAINHTIHYYLDREFLKT